MDVEKENNSTEKVPTLEELEKEFKTSPEYKKWEAYSSALNDMKGNVSLIEKGSEHKETRFITRVLRKIPSTRKRITRQIFNIIIRQYMELKPTARDELFSYLSTLPEEGEVVEPLPSPQLKQLREAAAAAAAAAATTTPTSTSTTPTTSSTTPTTPSTPSTTSIPPTTTSSSSSSSSSGTEVMEVENATTLSSTTAAPASVTKEKVVPVKEPSLEVEAYLHLLVLIYVLDRKQSGVEISTALVKKVSESNSRTLFPLAARSYFYFSRSYELSSRWPEIRSKLLHAHHTACLRHDDEGQATILNLLLRNYLAENEYSQASKLLSKTSFPDFSSSSPQLARYYYYQGRIEAIIGESSSLVNAEKHLVQALRKAPQQKACGFRQTVFKLLCIVQMLLGQIPERNAFTQPGFSKSTLNPYLQLTRAVRVGDVEAFNDVISRFSAVFVRDQNNTLIQRLRQNVITTGLRKINKAYSRISLVDVSRKLHLDNVEDAEYIVAKAIRDQVIEAKLDNEKGVLECKKSVNIYSTQQPQELFHKRISFCINLHNEAVRAMRYPPDAHKPHKESDEVRKERLKQEQELAKLVEDDDDDEEDDF